MRVLGIDPGFRGSLAIYDTETQSVVSCIDMPLVVPQGKRPAIDAFALAAWIGVYAVDIRLAVVEYVHAMPGQSVQSMFRFGYGAGMIHGILSSFNVEIKFLSPSAWKAVLGLSSDKNRSLVLARKLFPHDAPLFARKRDDGRAEAVLLAYLGGLLLKSGAMRGNGVDGRKL